MEENYYLSPNIEIVKGSNKSAVYNFNNRKVLWTNKIGYDILQLINDKKDTDDIIKVISNQVSKSQPETRDIIEDFISKCINLEIISNVECPNIEDVIIDNKLKEVWLEITSNCNLKCLHCYGSCGNINKKDIDLEHWIAILKHIKAIGCHKLQITGGEPLMRKDALIIIEEAIDQNINVELYSNLTLFNSGKFKHLHNKLSIATTVLGPNDNIHDSITGVKGSFNKTLDAIRSCLDMGFKLRANTIIMKNNSDYIDDIRKLLTDIGVKNIGTDYIRSVGRGNTGTQYDGFKRIKSKPRYNISKESFYYNKQYNSCLGHKFAVTSEGDIIPCIFTRDEIAGNLTKTSIENILQELEEKFWTLTLDKIEKCSQCEFRYSCHDCRPLSITEGSGLYGPSPRCGYNPLTGSIEM